MFGSLLAMFRLVPPASLPENLGFQLYRAVYGFDAFVGPNPRHNVFGVVYFGTFGAIVYSLMLGMIVGFIRNRLSAFMRPGSAVEPLFVFLAISCVWVSADIGMLMKDIGSLILVAPVLYAMAAIVSAAPTSSVSAVRYLALQAAVSEDS